MLKEPKEPSSVFVASQIPSCIASRPSVHSFGALDSVIAIGLAWHPGFFFVSFDAVRIRPNHSGSPN